MAIFLDTNVLPWRGSGDSVRFATIPILAGELGQEVLVPDLVLEEAVACRQREIESVLEKLRSTHKKAQVYADMPELELPSAAELSRQWRAQFMTKAKIVKAPNGALEEAINREINRIRPTRNGRGARDAIIWITVKSVHKKRSEVGYFVSENKADFASPDDLNNFHPELLKEISSLSKPLHYCNSIDSLLSKIASKSELQITLELVESYDIVHIALRSFIQDNLILREVSPSLPSGKEYISSKILLFPRELKFLHAYHVGDHDIVFAQIIWEISLTIGILQKGVGGGFARSYFPEQINLLVHIWMRFNENEARPSLAEVSFIQPWKQ